MDILANREFWQSLGITFYYMAITAVAEMLLGLAIALVLNKDFWGKNGVEAVVLLPYMVAPVTVGLMWMPFYKPSSGLLNYIFTAVGLPRSAFMSTRQTVIPAITAMETWQVTPMVVTVCLAELSSLPTDPVEAARVDGATSIQTFFQVTLPLLTRTLFSVGLLRFIDVFKSFDLIYAITKRGPVNASRALSLFACEAAFSYYRLGSSSTMFMILFVIVLLLSILIMRIRRRLVAHYGG